MSTFAANSRYAQTTIKTLTLDDGREVNYLARRFLPQPDELAQFGVCTVVAGDRLDTIAARVFGKAELFWRLVEEVGRALRLTLPAGFPGAFGA